jgi:alpha-L-fucosidase 2
MSLRKYALMDWEFPADRLHRGIPLGSGNFGALIWGDGRPLNISLGHMEYWETRGIYEFREGYGFKHLEKCVAEKQRSAIGKIAYRVGGGTKDGPYNTRLPLGRLTIDVGGSARSRPRLKANLDIGSGIAHIHSRAKNRRASSVEAFSASSHELLVIRLKGAFARKAIEAIPGPIDKESIRKLRSWGYPAPKRGTKLGVKYWAQEQPTGGAVTVGYKVLRKGRNEMIVLLSAAVADGSVGNAPQRSLERVTQEIGRGEAAGYEELRAAQRAWWKKFWSGGGEIDIPDDDLAQTYYFWLYKLASSSRPGKLPVSLQGPWVEDYGLPPWSSDYHADVNIQECYWPVYTSNHLELAKALIGWVERSMPQWERYGKALTGVDDALFMPVSTNNDGQNISYSAGWSACHLWPGNGPWLAHNLWWLYTFSGDENLLRELVYPFLKKCLNAYETLLGRDGSGRLHLTLSHSPEWMRPGLFYQAGKNTSIDLALVHFLARALIRASEILGVDRKLRPGWREIERKLPIAALHTPGKHDEPWDAELAIWEGEPLSVSHRHMSHLIGIYPLALMDLPGRNEHSELALNSIKRLWALGTGLWAGWSFPWASMIMARAGFGDAAYHYLKVWRRAFSNRALASYHDEPAPAGASRFMERKELMQLDGGFGAAAAVPEMLLQSWWGEIRLFPALPDCWKRVSFKSFRAEGAFIISAEYADGRTVEARIKSTAGGTCRLRNSFGKKSVNVKNLSTGKIAALSGDVVTFETNPHERFLVR